jgi:hypothetical protein
VDWPLWAVAAAAAPIVLLAVVVLRSWPVPRAAWIASLVAAALAVVAFGLDATEVGVGVVRGLWTGAWILLIVLPALLLFEVLDRSGALDRLADASDQLAPTEGRRLLLLAWVMPSFLQGAAGFGAPIAMAAPMLVRRGMAPVAAVAACLVGYQWSVTFGSMGSSYFMAEATARLDEGAAGSFALRTEENPDDVVLCCDPFHPNDVDVLSPDMAPAFHMFEAGDLLISLRSINMIAVVDPETARVKWSQIGPWFQQHDPDFLPNGTISLYNNNMGLGASQIMVVDPATGETKVVFDGARHGNFYSWRRGRHQPLANSNIMITESERGRVIEVTPDGRIVWQYENIYDAEWNGLVNDALVLPLDFFDEGALTCPRL